VDHAPVIVELTAEVDKQFAVDIIADGSRRHVQCGVLKRQLEVASQRRSVQQLQQQSFARYRLNSEHTSVVAGLVQR